MNNTPADEYAWIHDCGLQPERSSTRQYLYDAYAAGRPGYPSARKNGLARCLPYAVSCGGRPTEPRRALQLDFSCKQGGRDTAIYSVYDRCSASRLCIRGPPAAV